ncbi:hypothetical protein BO99DRAFT_415948 [Aspergillus violaceofuscus CBS 115571]|uniref:Uncharacterized protein n=1 Tax=Aspergillus violaceofuscus (strain CBS 115571) TaxID=1450538 RepID=A0A2V5GW09_ASPV1|nr:hypothetical protein BO99DRAFT_415948 [Aspergillus violaceofuscus CBS 115571]
MLQDIDCEVEQLLKLFTLLSQHRGGFRCSWLHQVATGAAQLLQRSNAAAYYFVVAEPSFQLQLLNNFIITAARTPGSEISYDSLPIRYILLQGAYINLGRS